MRPNVERRHVVGEHERDHDNDDVGAHNDDDDGVHNDDDNGDDDDDDGDDDVFNGTHDRRRHVAKKDELDWDRECSDNDRVANCVANRVDDDHADVEEFARLCERGKRCRCCDAVIVVVVAVVDDVLKRDESLTIFKRKLFDVEFSAYMLAGVRM